MAHHTINYCYAGTTRATEFNWFCPTHCYKMQYVMLKEKEKHGNGCRLPWCVNGGAQWCANAVPCCEPRTRPRKTSVINGREYVPFLETDKRDRFAFKLPFCDPDGKLSLSPKQRASFSHWARLEELSHDPKIIELVDCFSIRQVWLVALDWHGVVECNVCLKQAREVG